MYKTKFAFLPTALNSMEDSPVIFLRFYKERKTADRRYRRYKGHTYVTKYVSEPTVWGY